MKTLDNTNSDELKKNVSDVKIFGNPDLFKCICKVSSEKEGWIKSTKAMETEEGCIVQVSTQQRNPDCSYAVAEALIFVPNVSIRTDKDGNRYLY